VGFAHVTQAWFEQDAEALDRLESVLRARYLTLHAFVVNGECHVCGTFAAVDTDRYALDIALPGNYPHAMPVVWETGGRIPREIDRHVFVNDGSLCLGTPLALWVQLGGNYSIERVIDGPLKSFLIGNSLIEEGEPWPYGDRAHGAPGILEHLGELIGTNEPKVVGRFLIDLLKQKVRGHWPCPCGSGRIIRKCHRDGVGTLQKAPPRLVMHAVETIAKDLEMQPHSPSARA
jgi:hypothetical protein